MEEEINKTYEQIENKILNHEIYQNVKDYSRKLTNKFGNKYSSSLLYKIKQFYNIIEKVPTLSGKLTWSHWYEMLSFEDINKIYYYVNQCETYNLDVRELRKRIKSNEYERLPVDIRSKLKSRDEINVIDLVKNPIHIKNSKNKEIISEKILQKLILEDIPSFLEELGDSFTYIRNEYKIKIELY